MNITSHSIMFHHFHDEKHIPSQGSLNRSDFKKMLDWLNKNYTLLNASEFKTKFENGTLRSTDICLSFDDGLKCQYDIALPIIDRLGIQAYFFVYSSVFSDNPDPLEIFRYFRTSDFEDINQFYELFFEEVKKINYKIFLEQHSKYLKLNYLSAFPFYSENDKWFRYIRDQYLSNEKYNQIMHALMLKRNFNINLAKKNLWMTEKDILNTDSKGHLIGLHSYSHPRQMSKLSKAQQNYEYQANYDHLTNLIGKPIKMMSHPCGDYNETTLKILRKMNIQIGFRSNMSETKIISPLEIPREDHTNVFKEMHK